MSLTRTHAYFAVSVLSATLDLGAQSPAWNNLKTIPPGEMVRVDVAGRRGAIHGTLQSVADDSINVNSRSGAIATFKRPEVARVFVRKHGHRVRNVSNT